MTKFTASFYLGGAIWAIAGCTTMPGFQLTSGSASLQVQPQILAGGYHAQTLVAPWSAQDVSHIEISLLTLTGAGEESPALLAGKPLVQDLPRTGLGAPFTVTGLMPNTRYRLRARAFKSEGTLTTEVISTEAAFVDVAVLTDDRPAVATLSIPLKDVPFDGHATSPVEILPGHLTPVGSESLQLGEQTE